MSTYPQSSPLVPWHVLPLLAVASVATVALLGAAPLIGHTLRDAPAQPANPAIQPVPAVAQPALPSAISVIFRPSVQYWGAKISAWAETAGIDPNLLATVMQIESCGDPNAVSGSGAQGLFQVMPFHFAEGENMQDPDTNALRSTNYLKQGLAISNGNASLTLAGYNGGHSQISKAFELWPQETQRYFHWGSGIFQEASSGAGVSPTLEAWLAAGGASLCEQAEQRLGIP
ncbi:MAG TPA: transglycosylase SLT domain-containing protein [Anaerolineales bacterium]|nr:transglycosylase SLT domain-containing protein [Anaerolineales bacterium]